MWPFRKRYSSELAMMKEYQEAQSRMKKPSLIQDTGDFRIVSCVYQVLYNHKGRRGIQVANSYRSLAIHEINNDLSFSKIGPYWTKVRWSGNPITFALCAIAISNNPLGISNPQSQVRCYGLSIQEMNTQLLPDLSFKDWCYMFGK